VLAAGVLALTVHSTSAAAQSADYARAERLLPWNTSLLVSGDSVRPEWLLDGNRFWYRNKTARGADYVLIDPVRNTRALLFDNVRLAAALSVATDTSYDPTHLPFRSFKFADDGKNEHVIEFDNGKRHFSCDIAAYRCATRDTTPSDVPYVLSPDKKWEAFVRDYNVYVRPRNGKDSVQLTTDGVHYWAYGLADPRPSELLRKHPRPRHPMIRWSPDSKKIAVDRMDDRRVELMYYISATSQRPRLFSQPYALPGDTIIPRPSFHIIDVASKGNVAVTVPPQSIRLSFTGSARDSGWAPGSDKVYATYFTRGSKAVYLIAADASTGKWRVIVGDSAKTFVEFAQADQPSWYVTHDGSEVIWWSERDGWAHLYLVDVATGKVKNQITAGAWAVGAVEHVDEKARQIYFTARGREAGRNIYYEHLYRVGFDGSGLTLITPEDANHEITFSPSGTYFVDTYSRIETPPVTVLRAVPDGHIVRKLEEADVSRLVAAGWHPAQVFSVKARDGITDLYGVLYLPPNLDPKKKYPIISHIYPGPQVGSVGRWEFKSGGEDFSLAALGFVVIQLDHLGTPLRSKAFHDNYYGNFGDNGLPDHIAAIKQLAAQYPFIDLDRVGIYGHSGGGFASTDAILRYPDFFKVAVSGAGNHDNRTYNIYWAEKYQGLLERDTLRKTDNFETSANKTMAKNLRGHLLLMHGDMDDNVNPANTIQVVDALIKANKTFDLIIAPNRNHGLNEPYFIRRRWDYFVQYLLGETPPVDYQITRPVDPAASQEEPASESAWAPDQP
jgi:dipeptidyl aminopeptidase/acylaminoacyl peptidase